MQKDKIAAFDFDGTIVSKDTTLVFIKWIIGRSIIRIMLSIFVLPLTSILAVSRSTRTYGGSIIWYIATACQSKNLFRLRSEFVDYYLNDSGAIVFEKAVEKIKMHQNDGNKVVIISGCPPWLMRGFTKKLGLHNIKLVGSKLIFAGKGLLFKEHCYSSNKLKMAREQGLSPETWYYGYSDGISDIHWLRLCDVVYVVNPSHRKLAKFRNVIGLDINVVKWV